MNLDLMAEYHRRTDHGRDGVELDGFLCNCRQLFEEYVSTILTLLKKPEPDEPRAHPDTMIGKR